MPFASTRDGISIYYELHLPPPSSVTSTTTSTIPLLLLSGQGSSHHAWDDLKPDFLASGLPVLVFDYRGTGDSSKPTSLGPYTTRQFASDVTAVLDHAHLDRVHVYGVSFGSRVAQWLAVDFPSYVCSVVLGCSTPGNAFGVRRAPDLDELMAEANYTHPRLLSTLVSSVWLLQNPWFLDRLAAPPPSSESHVLQKLHWNASESHDCWKSLPLITCPVLLIHGSEDCLNPTANVFLLQRQLPQAETYVVQGGRHCYHIEFRREVSAVIVDFLRRNQQQLHQQKGEVKLLRTRGRKRVAEEPLSRSECVTHT